MSDGSDDKVKKQMSRDRQKVGGNMKFSIVIPQMFYDLIARILPGFFFLAFLFFSLPGWGRPLYLPIVAGGNSVDSLGILLGYAVLCYFLGWLFLALTWDSKRLAFLWGSKRKEVKAKYDKDDSMSINEKYQRIRIAHPEAGFRIVKLRAEARMLEATRTAMVAIMIITIIYLIIYIISLILENRLNVTCVRPFIGLFVAGITYYTFRKREVKVWDNYYANINVVYKILEEYVDPVRLFP